MSGVGDMSAFPHEQPRVNYPQGAGMTLRDWFAGQALSGWLASWPKGVGEVERESVERVAEFSYRLADAMLAARAKPSDEQAMQHVAYFDEGEFHWMSGIKPRDCELYAARTKGGES